MALLAADPSEYKGRWNHWAFTKDARSGEMKIFLKVAEDEGGVPAPRYTHPREVTLQLSSPQLAQYVRLIGLLDQTLMLVFLIREHVE